VKVTGLLSITKQLPFKCFLNFVGRSLFYKFVAQVKRFKFYTMNNAHRYFLLLLGLLLVIPSTTFSQERKYILYGFGQIDYQASDKKNFINGFNQRRVNLIGEYFLDQNIRVLTDLEYEGGADMSASDSVFNGGFKVSRMWVEYTVMPELKIRAGKMLTPFGLYNLIHDASASYYAVDPPIMYLPFAFFPGIPSQRLIAKYSTGLEFLGTINLNNRGAQLEYDFGISNGRGMAPDGTDANQNKAVYGRLMLRPSLVQGLQLGTSFYHDKNAIGIGGTIDDDETNFGFDVQYESRALQIQAESMFSKFANPFARRQTATVSYAQAAYTLWDVFTPFLNFTSVLPNISNNDHSYQRWNIGLNYALSLNLYVKTEIQFHSFEEDHVDGSFNMLKSSLAVAF